MAYDNDRLKDAIKGAMRDPAVIEFLVKNGDRYSTARIDYHDGLCYPHFKRDPSVPALLDQILEPRG